MNEKSKSKSKEYTGQTKKTFYFLRRLKPEQREAYGNKIFRGHGVVDEATKNKNLSVGKAINTISYDFPHWWDPSKKKK